MQASVVFDVMIYPLMSKQTDAFETSGHDEHVWLNKTRQHNFISPWKYV